MKEKYESLSLAVLKDLAKARGLKGVYSLRKVPTGTARRKKGPTAVL